MIIIPVIVDSKDSEESSATICSPVVAIFSSYVLLLLLSMPSAHFFLQYISQDHLSTLIRLTFFIGNLILMAAIVSSDLTIKIRLIRFVLLNIIYVSLMQSALWNISSY